MGFFSKLVGVATGIVRSFIGAPAPSVVARTIVAPARAALARGAAAGRRFVKPALFAGAGAGAGAIAASGGDGEFFGPGGAPGIMAAGGNGVSFRRTIVQTVDRASGQITQERVLRGSPFIMRHDIVVAKRVIRMASKLGNVKGLRHTVQQGIASQITQAVKRKVLQTVVEGVKC